VTRGGIESYLMKKWLGTLPPGYVDWTGATVGGAGTVRAARPKDLPQFDGFTGTLDLDTATLAFTLDGATKTVAEAFDIGAATLKLASEGAFTFSFVEDQSKIGSYTLATFGSLAEPGLAGWTCPKTTADEKYRICVTVKNGRLVAEVVPRGLQVILR